MAVGWAGDGAVTEQISATIADAAKKAREKLPSGESLIFCEDCGEEIPKRRREALPGVRLCVACQTELEQQEERELSLFNRRGSKDSQLK